MANLCEAGNLALIIEEAASATTLPENVLELAQTNIEISRIVAQNTCTPPQLLGELAAAKDYQVRQAVVSNPNTPTDTLFQLGTEFPSELLENPVFTLLFLENLDLLTQMPEETAACLLKLESVPDEFIQWGLSRNRLLISLALAMNPKTPKDDLEAMVNSRHSKVAAVAKLHVQLAPKMTTGWKNAVSSALRKRKLTDDYLYHEISQEIVLWEIGAISESLLGILETNVHTHIARNPDTPTHILQSLLENLKRVTKNTRLAAAGNINTPVSILEQLVGDNDRQVRLAAFLNPHTPSQIIQRWYSESAAVNNPQTSGEKLCELLQSQWLPIRRGVALHQNTPVSILENLSKAKDSQVRMAVAENKKTPKYLLETLAYDRSIVVRYAIVENPNTPSSIIEKLSSSKNQNTRERAALSGNATPEMLQQLAQDFHYYVRRNVAANPKTPVAALARLMDDIDYVRSHLARNPNLNDEILTRLATDKYTEVRVAVAQHPKTSVSLLAKLASDTEKRVRCEVVRNPNTPEDIITQLADDPSEYIQHEVERAKKARKLHDIHKEDKLQTNHAIKAACSLDTPIEKLLELAQSKDTRILIPAISNLCQKLTFKADISTTILEELAAISHVNFFENVLLELYTAIARHPNTPSHTLEQLSKRSNASLRRLIIDNPNISVSHLEQFLQDKSHEVRHAALLAYKQKSPQITTDCNFLKEWETITNPNTPIHKLIELTRSQWILIREALAQYTNSTLILEILAKDKLKVIKIAVAKNPLTPLNILEKLAECPNTDKLHQAAVKTLMEHYPQQAIKFIEGYINVDTVPTLGRFLVLSHPLTSTNMLIKHSRSFSWLERYAISQNPNTPKSVCQQLAVDANWIVQAAAKASLENKTWEHPT
ncbi:hypothetical protein [Calothrix sp. PCC 6303]|uniref:hypothetical protein n=1 Tax=Calothrix sp. PCC 6303 TaxID=1170562 RepID=UPI0002A0224B|nr:hypothetical protein [Calothrix sp. PCC 6303]AFZ03248.1 leucine rich repeat variant-containing protein [Calothrix sp. PCC 6303]